jgi:hypothetical protein
VSFWMLQKMSYLKFWNFDISWTKIRKNLVKKSGIAITLHRKTKSVGPKNLVRCLKKLMDFETTDQIFCEYRFFCCLNRFGPLSQKTHGFRDNGPIFFETTDFEILIFETTENRFQSVGALTKFSGSPTDFVFRCG